MTKSEIETEIKSMSEAGFGGAEIVPVSTGGEGGDSIDWGTDQWNEMIKHMLQVAGKYDFTIDFTMTPAWPLALPTIKDLDDPNSGAQMEVDANHVDGITKENPYSGKVPVATELDAGTPVLLAVTVAKYVDKENNILDYDSAQTLNMETQVVQNSDDPTDYTVNFTPEDDGEYVLFGWWQHPSGEQKYGNYQVDHFGKAGSQAIIDYWENNLLPYYGEDFKNASALFIDSLEFTTHLDWTLGLLDDFKAYKNYDITAYLPAVYDTDSQGNYSGEPQPDFQFNKNSDALQNDYKDTLTQLYIENHLKPLSEFCEKHGVDLRYQTSYGKSLELPQTAMYVDIPETETLYGKDIIDFYRLQSGAVHMTDKEIYSIEASPEQNISIDLGSFVYNMFRGNGEEGAGNYQQTWDDQMWHVQRAFAGGVNQIVFHGHSYNGQYDGEGNENGYVAGTQWPGFEGFGANSWSNSWGDRIPSWKHAQSYTDYIARNQYILRQGESKVDLAIYAQRYFEKIDFSGAEKVYKDDELLTQSGYTYDFVSPSALSLENAVVSNGRLDESGPAYKAIILNQQETLTVDAANQLLNYAKQGFPIIIVGDAPSQDAFCENADIAGIVSEIMACDSVVQVSGTASVPQALEQLGVTPDVSYSQQDYVINVHRQTDSTDFYYLYNYGNADNYPAAKEIQPVTTEVTLQGSGIPYFLNTWTGEVTPVSQYTRNGNSVTIPVTIAGNDSIMVALTNEDWGQEHSTYVTKSNLDTEFDGQTILAKSYEAGTETVTLSNNKKVLVETEQVAAPMELSSWNLSVESWSKGDTPTDTKKTTIDVGTVDGLKPWTEISGLENVSGIGTYTTSFNLEQGWEEGIGAIISLGDVVDSYQIYVNGTQVPVSQIDTTIDIGKYLKSGENTITVEVASTLLNAVLVANPTDTRKPDEYGMMGPVVLTPYQVTEIELVDKGILNSVIAYAENAKASGEYDNAIESVQKSFDKALEEAKTIAADHNATQETIDQAWKTLLNEIHKLGFVAGDKTTLASLIEAANGINAELDRYVETGKAEFTAALEAAQAVYQDGDAMQTEVNEAADNLLNTMLNLRYKADKSILEEVLAEANNIDANIYTEESYAVLQTAIAEANEVMANENATQEEVDTAVANLQTAIKGLISIEGIEDKTPSADNNGIQMGQESTMPKADAAKTGDCVPIVGIIALTIAGAATLLLCKKR
ncbi:MAG: hypothetical protein DBX37_05520 [Massilioclostridium sp.]|nr:MAG: hypothetical protein DBX37_05520 [Massilioclostridium sp.]